MAFAFSSKLGSRTTVASKRSSGIVRANQEVRQYLKSLPGVTQPFPNVFDPAGISSGATIEDIRRWRESEITHGRVAMLAALGFVVQENVKDIPEFYPFGGHIVGPAIYHFQQIRQGFWEPLLIAIGLAEAYRVTVGWANPIGKNAKSNYLNDEYNMGQLGFDPLGLAPKDPEAFKDMQSRELNNGRLAMIAVAGFVVQELVFQREFLTLPWVSHEAPRIGTDQFALPQNLTVAKPGVVGGPPTPPLSVPAGVPTRP